MFVPQGAITLVKGVPWDSTYNHTRLFNDESEQISYFESLSIIRKNEYTTIRENMEIKVGASIEELRGYNYIYYQNGYNGKIIYSFISSKHYINDRTTSLTVEVDVLQTYMFDYELMHSFVDRCHVKRWENGRPTSEVVDEGIPIQEYDVESTEVIANTPRQFIMVSTTPLGMVKDGGYIPPAGGDLNDPNIGTGTYLNGYGGSWLVPCLGTVTANWGSYTSGSYVHDGIDIANIEGSPIYASQNGTVAVVGDNGSQTWGKYVDISHGNGYMTRYAHCLSISVEVGQTIQRGQQIAKMGNTGNSTGNHLHWGVYKDGKAIDVDTRDILKLQYRVEQGKGNI